MKHIILNQFVCRVDVENTLYNGYCNHGDESDVEDDDMMMCDCFQNNTCNVKNMMFTCNQKGKLYSQKIDPSIHVCNKFQAFLNLLISKSTTS